MSNSNLTSYNFHDSNIRVVQNDKGEVLFCLADVCTSLNLTTPAKTASQIKDEFQGGELNSYPLQTKGGVQQCTMITEPQLYFVMMRSNSKIAREFRQWICNEVLPSIRAQGAYVANASPEEKEAEIAAKKYDWYIEQLTELFNKNKISKGVLVSTINIAQRVFKTGYVVALKDSTDKQDKQPKADERLTITEDEFTAIDHMVYYHDKFRPETLKAYKKIAEIQSQVAKLLVAIQDIPTAQLYESATAPDISAQKLKRFNSTKVKKGALVVGA